MQRRKWKDCKRQRWLTAPRKQSSRMCQGWCMYEHTLTVTLCMGPAQTQARQNPNTESGKWAQGLMPGKEAIWNRQLLGEGRLVFFSGVTLSYSHTCQNSGVVGQPKLNRSICFCYLSLICFGFICFGSGLVIFFPERKRVRKWVD